MAAEVEVAPATAAGRKLRLRRRAELSVCWERWELLMLAKEEEQAQASGGDADEDWEVPEQSQSGAAGGAAGGSGSGASSSYYAHWDNPTAHLTYLQDEALLYAFQTAITQHADLLKDKVVLDLGCGPGHLAMMAARAGARRVYAVDASAGAAAAARAVVAANGMGDRVTVMHADAESLVLPRGEKVDVIISDALGPLLLGGGMLRALAIARRRLLKPGGLVLPDEVSLHVAGVDDRDFLVDAKDTWAALKTGFDMGPALGQLVRSPRRDTLVRESALFTSRCLLLTLRLDGGAESQAGGSGGDQGADEDEAVRLTARAAGEAGFSAPFELTAVREERLFALMFWFDASFSFGGSAGATPVLFSTDPSRPATHHQQLLLNFPKSIRVGRGDTVSGVVTWRPSPGDHRCVAVTVEVEYKGVVASADYTVPAILP